ncbi:MAG: cbb3-type cytochrome c oxidase subunit II [Ferruginibacter sp.]
MDFFNNHKNLFLSALGLFLFLTIIVAIIPAAKNVKNNAPLRDAIPLSSEALKGKAVYVANGCVACHTQQVRNVEMDKVWGSRPSIAADYAFLKRTDVWRNTATLMGTERTGPDLATIGSRQPSLEWHLVHMFNPRIVVKESIMPAYPWMFEIKENPAKGDVIVNVPVEFLKGKKGKVVAGKEALQLIAYLQSLVQVQLPDGSPDPEWLYKRNKNAAAGEKGGDKGSKELDGVALYAANCQSCHQANGEGLPGAFPSLKGSKVVLDDKPDLMVDIIMNGYSAREKEGYPPMPAIGKTSKLTAEEIAAIISHERTSWGNNAKKVTAEEVKTLMEMFNK